MNLIRLIPASFILMLSLFSHAVLAESTADDRAQQATDTMIEELQLNGEQSTRVLELNKQTFSQIAELREADQSRFSKYRSLKKVVQERDRSMQEILSDAQYDTYLSSAKERRQQLKTYLKEQDN
ncbi:MAG: DUF4890 domain-containing protein [Amphritea sp.]|nr:DUF4890 domain-containing protein [Amphritea sp.]